MAGAVPRVHRLANGVSVICEPMVGLESFALSVAVGRGARLESPERSGWSHLLEHMVFKGAGGRSAQEIVEAVSADDVRALGAAFLAPGACVGAALGSAKALAAAERFGRTLFD